MLVPWVRVRISVASVLVLERDGQVLLWRDKIDRPTFTLPGGVARLLPNTRSQVTGQLKGEFDERVADGYAPDLRVTLRPRAAIKLLAGIRAGRFAAESGAEALCRELLEEADELGLGSLRSPNVTELQQILQLDTGPRWVKGSKRFVFRRFSVFALNPKVTSAVTLDHHLISLALSHPTHVILEPIDGIAKGVSGNQVHSHVPEIVAGVRKTRLEHRVR